MSGPKVPTPKDAGALDSSCSFVHDNTLYSFSENGFLSLPLQDSAQWKTLSMEGGVKVKGAACTGKEAGDASSLIVVGGWSDNNDYSGVQEYNFKDQKWTQLAMDQPYMKNRVGHSALYNPATTSIVVFSGVVVKAAGDAPGASGDTFKIDVRGAPDSKHQVNAGTAPDGGRANVVRPMLFPWDGADCALISGPGDDGNVYLFNTDLQSQPGAPSSWRKVGSISPEDSWAADSTGIRATLVKGSDNSFNILKFNLAASPNTVDRILVAHGAGGAMYNAKKATTNKRNLDVSEANWPAYNATNAPNAKREGAAIAQGPDGMIVLSGGNKDEPVALFNAQKNTWFKAADVLGDQSQKILATSSTTTTSTTTSSTFTTSVSSTTSSTITATPTESSPASTPEKHGPSSNAILGITLGTIAAFLALLLVILLLLKRRKRRMNPNQGAVLNPDEKDTVAFAKSTQPSASPAHYRGHNPQLSTESYSSVAILMGRMGPQKQERTNGKTSRASDRSSIGSLHKQFKSTISKPIPQPSNNPMLEAHDDRGVAFDPSVAEPRPRNGPMPTQDGTRRSSGWNKYWSGGSALQILGYGNKRATATSERSSRYSEANSTNNNATGHSVRATQDSATVPPLNFEGPPEVNSVNTGSPIVSQYSSKVPTEGIAGTIERPVSPMSSVSGYSSGVPESINEMFQHSDRSKPWGTDRAPSSIYQHNKADSTSAPQTSGVSQQPQLAMAATSSDMSWLNLGDQSRK